MLVAVGSDPADLIGMTPFPHQYTVIAAAGAEGTIETHADRLPALTIASPAEFGGPGDLWSPESLMTAAVANCLVLTFRAVAKASNVVWTRLDCDVTGTLDRVDRVVQFTHFEIRARLGVPAGADSALAIRALEKAHRGCLIANSLKATMDLHPEVYTSTGEPVGAATAG